MGAVPPYSVDHWDVSSVITMSAIFSWITTFNQPIGHWDVSSVTIKSGMFYFDAAFNQPISA